MGTHSVFRTKWLDAIETSDGEIQIGDYSTINASILRGPLKIGNNVLVNVGCDLTAFRGAPIQIGNDVLLAPRVVILSSMHQYRERQQLIREQGMQCGSVIVEDDVWIGTSAVILPGVHIGKGAVIGANAVVSGDVEPYTVVGGVPARKIGERV